MSYPGNASLAAEIQQRILETFEHTLDLAAGGKQTEALTGCTFILKLDPLFEAAQTLKDRLGADGAVAVDDLRIAASDPTPVVGQSLDIAESFGDVFPTTQPTAEQEANTDLASALDLSAFTQPAAPAAPAADTVPAATELPAGSETSEVAALDSALDLSALAADLSAAATEPAAETPPSVPEPEVPPAEEPAAAPSETPSAAADSESANRVQTLLDEGQAAFENREYQTAIDSWSRIFLVDIDHPEASRRIELARKLKDEVERQVEELFHEAVAKVEGGDLDGARVGFNEVLEIQPTHLAAQEYLEKLDAGAIEHRPAATEAPPATATSAAPNVPPVGDLADAPDTLEMAVDALHVPGLQDDFSATGGDQLNVDIPPPPAAKKTQPKPKKAGGKGIRPAFLYIGGAVLLLVAVGAWLLMRNWNTTFPNATAEAPRIERPQVDPIARAQQLHSEGKTPLAVAQLRRVPPSHPQYAEAQALVAQWDPPAEEAETAAVSPEQRAELDRLVAEARAAFDRREFFSAEILLTQAAANAALGDEAIQLQQATAVELEPLRSTIAIFRQGEWAEALRGLWKLRGDDPGNADIERLMVDSYYNLGVRALQRADPVEAAEHFGEALEITDDDFELQRASQFTEAYSRRTPDLLYRIFVKYLPFR